MEILFLLVGTALVFGLFFLVFILKGTANDQPARFHTCGNCSCHRSENPADHSVQLSADREPCRSDPSRASMSEDPIERRLQDDLRAGSDRFMKSTG